MGCSNSLFISFVPREDTSFYAITNEQIGKRENIFLFVSLNNCTIQLLFKMIGRLVRRANKLSFVSYQKKVPSNLYFQLSESSDMKYADGFAIAK